MDKSWTKETHGSQILHQYDTETKLMAQEAYFKLSMLYDRIYKLTDPLTPMDIHIRYFCLLQIRKSMDNVYPLGFYVSPKQPDVAAERKSFWGAVWGKIVRIFKTCQ